MTDKLMHIYRNTPFGLETLLQSAFFCKKMKNVEMTVYIPKHIQFLMYFESEVITVDLDSSYTRFSESARERVIEILDREGVDFIFYQPKDFTASTLPNIPVSTNFMTCPRSIVESPSNIGIGFIGSRVRRIIKNAHFPILMATPIYKEWSSIVAFYGGSQLGCKTVKTAFSLANRMGMPISLFTQLENQYQNLYEKNLKENGLLDKIRDENIKWSIFDSGELEDNLFNIPSSALLVVGATGHGNMKELLFGSKFEKILQTLPNPILVIGPKYSQP